jgi:hypothetical protein
VLNEMIATALEQLAYAIREYPVHPQITIKTLINYTHKASAEIIIQFSAQKDAKAINFLEVEVALWRSKKSAATLIIEAFSSGKEVLREEANLQHLDDAYPYFEKALELFNLEKTE